MSDIAVPEAAPVTLFRTDDPQEMIARATDTANALAAVVRAKRLTVKIGQGEFVKLEGWTLLGSLVGVFPVCVWSHPLVAVRPVALGAQTLRLGSADHFAGAGSSRRPPTRCPEWARQRRSTRRFRSERPR